MNTQIKHIGSSKGVIIPPEFLKFNELDVGDWVDISDIVKVRGKENEIKDNN